LTETLLTICGNVARKFKFAARIEILEHKANFKSNKNPISEKSNFGPKIQLIFLSKIDGTILTPFFEIVPHTAYLKV